MCSPLTALLLLLSVIVDCVLLGFELVSWFFGQRFGIRGFSVAMKEDNQSEKKASRFADQNQAPKVQNGNATNGHRSKPRSSWGSHIVKGFTAEKKNKTKPTEVSKKLPLSANADIANQTKNCLVPAQPRVKRSLIGDLACSVNGTQVHPHSCQTQTHRRQSSGSRDLFVELDSLRTLLQESKEREFKLQAELSEWKRNPKVLELERELESRKNQADELARKLGLLENENKGLSEQLSLISERNDSESPTTMAGLSPSRDLEMEVVELRRLNKQLQMEKRNLACKLSSVESQLASLAKASEVCNAFIYFFSLFLFGCCEKFR